MRQVKLQDQSLDQSIWFLDYDGSLCPHHEVWEQRNYDVGEIFDTLLHLKSTGAEIYWNTGRRIESLGGVEERFLEFPGYFVQGSVSWDAATKTKSEYGPKISKAILDHYDAVFAKEKDFRIEHKPTGMRIAPVHLKFLNVLREKIDKRPTSLTVGDHSWAWHFGHRGAELLPVGYDKGLAVRRVYTDQSKLKKIPVMMGDDSLDRAAAEETLSRGGYFIAVGGGCGWVTEIPHKPEQLLYFDTPRDALDFLKSLKVKG